MYKQLWEGTRFSKEILIASDSADLDRLLVSLQQKAVYLHYSVQFNMNCKMKNVKRHSGKTLCHNMLKKDESCIYGHYISN